MIIKGRHMYFTSSPIEQRRRRASLSIIFYTTTREMGGKRMGKSVAK